MKKIFLLNILFSFSIMQCMQVNFNDDKSGNPIVLSNDDRKQANKLLTENSINSAPKTYKFFCCDEKEACKELNKETAEFKKKIKSFINQNIESSKNNYPSKIVIKYVYETNPNLPESEYFKRTMEIGAIYLLGGTLCRCSAPFSRLKEETYYIITGKELDENNPINKMSYDEFYQWSEKEIEKFDNILANLK